MKKKLLSTAIAAGMGMGLMSTAAQAVYVNAQGTGQVLLYPYYSADSGNDTYIEVVNTSDVGKAVKVRFLESKNSREVLDFNLYLSAHDVWTGAVTLDANGGAKLVTGDNSCTTPYIPAGGVPFRKGAYTGIGDSDTSIERTLEGHVEIIGMGDVMPDSDLETAITHVNGTLPTSGALTCDDMQAASYDATEDLTAPSGGLYGFATLLNVENGLAAVMDATALANFTSGPIWEEPGEITPNLADANTNALLFDGEGVVELDATIMATGEGDPVSAVLMTPTIENSYMVEPGVNGGTDWVVTFPTKFLYSANGDLPFTTAWDGTSTTGPGPLPGAACEDAEFQYWDREERGKAGDEVDFSPSDEAEGHQLCYEANVITINQTNVIGSPNAKNVNTDFDHGWMRISFDSANQFTADNVETNESETLNGLPAIGYSLMKYENGTIGGVLRNYMGASAHKEASPF